MIPFSEIQRIAVIRRNGLGDILCAIPLILRCKELMPWAEVSLFIEEANRSIAPYLQGPDRIVFIPTRRNKYLEMIEAAWRERNRRFDLAISAKTSPMKLMNFSLLALGARCRAAFIDDSWHSQFVNFPTPIDTKLTSHQALQTLSLIDPSLASIPPSLYPHLQGVGKIHLSTNPTLLISLSNNRAGSLLSPHAYASILNDLALQTPFSTIISCLPQDQLAAEKTKNLLSMDSQLIPTATFDEFLTLLNSVDLIFGGDGGIVHLAAALKKPALFLYSGTSVKEWGPLSDSIQTLYTPHHVSDIPQEEILKLLLSLFKKSELFRL